MPWQCPAFKPLPRSCNLHSWPARQALVDIVKHGLVDENQKVKTITALTVSALAEAASPYGIESFDDVLEPLWKGIRLLRGKVRCCARFACLQAPECL